jgi:hypothetical protein
MSSFSLPITTFVSARMCKVIPSRFLCRAASISCFRVFNFALRLLFSVSSAVILEFSVFFIFFSIWASGTSSTCCGAGSFVTAMAIGTGSCGAISTWTVDSNITGSGGTIFCRVVGSCVIVVVVRTGSCGAVSTWTVDSNITGSGGTIFLLSSWFLCNSCGC